MIFPLFRIFDTIGTENKIMDFKKIIYFQHLKHEKIKIHFSQKINSKHF